MQHPLLCQWSTLLTLTLSLAIISPAGGLLALVPAASPTPASASPVPSVLVVIRTSNLVVQGLYNRLIFCHCFRCMNRRHRKQPRSCHAADCKERRCHCQSLEFCCHDGSSFLPCPEGFVSSLSLLYRFLMHKLLGKYEENVKGVLHVMCNTPVTRPETPYFKLS